MADYRDIHRSSGYAAGSLRRGRNDKRLEVARKEGA
jgi:hypothetical protein